MQYVDHINDTDGEDRPTAIIIASMGTFFIDAARAVTGLRDAFTTVAVSANEFEPMFELPPPPQTIDWQVMRELLDDVASPDIWEPHSSPENVHRCQWVLRSKWNPKPLYTKQVHHKPQINRRMMRCNRI